MNKKVLFILALLVFTLSPVNAQAGGWVAFGDSVTTGAGASTTANFYSSRLESVVGSIENQGVSGSDIADQLITVQNYSGAAENVVLLTGYNDMKRNTPISEFKADLTSLLDILEARNNQVYLGGSFKLTPAAYALTNGSEAGMIAINNAIRDVARNYSNVVLVDVSNLTPEVSLDGSSLHPNDLGHLQLFQAFDAAISGVSLSPLSDSLAAYWNMDEVSGSRFDSLGENHLTDHNTVGQATGKIVQAALFASSSSEYLSLADNASLSTGDIDFTLSAWVYLNSKSANMFIVSKGPDATTGREYTLFYNQSIDRLRFIVVNGSNSAAVDANVFGSPSASTWYHILAWHDSVANTINISANGGSANSASYAFGAADTAGAFRIGGNSAVTPAAFWNGRIDEVGFWKRILTTEERAQVYNKGAGCSYPFAYCMMR